MWFAVWGALARAQEPAPAPEDDEAAREAELFGAPAPAPSEESDREAELFGDPAPAPVPAGTRDERLLGGPSDAADTEADLVSRLGRLDERLTIGGRLWLRAQGAVPDGVQGADEVALSAPNLLDLYADARPNDRVRAYARGRLQHDWTIRAGDLDPFTGEPVTPDVVLLDQLWIKADAAHRVYVTAGRQRIRWGTGRIWNPTDFLNLQRLDPLAILDLRTGVDLLKVHVPVEKANANLYAVANLQDAQALDQIGGALRAEWAFGQTEISASGALRKDQPVRLGTDLSSGVGPLDLKVEAAFTHGVTDPFWAGSLDPERLRFPREVDRSDDWLVQVVYGAEVSIRYSSRDSVAIGLEGFHNEAGYSGDDLYPWLLLQGQFLPFYLGRDYGAAYVLLAGPGDWDDQTFTASAIANLSDGSAVARLDWRGTVLTWLEPQAYVQAHFGDYGEFRYALEVPAVPGVPGLEDGLSVPAPMLDVGLGAIVRF